ncbi:MAG: TonB-dependent receptor [Saprospiraceae bacterium]|nr:TonB-dependent receptor [Saprospiraceae bacterium]
MGQDSIVLTAQKRHFANQNKRSARVLGFQASFKARITEGVIFSAAYNYTRGRIQNDGQSDSPLDHIPPVYGRVGVKYDLPKDPAKLNAEIFVLFNGKKDIKNYLLNGEDNERYAVPNYGMPAWWTFNARLSSQFFGKLTLQTGLDNIFDVQYRVFASGIHAPGRHLFVAARYSFERLISRFFNFLVVNLFGLIK